MALLGIFSISAMVMPTNTYASTVVANPYCDLVSDDYDGDCHDRYDFYEGGPNNGLFPCNDGSNRSEPKDCPDVSGFDYNDSSSDDGNNEDTSGCQEEDDFCDADEGCQSDSVDCIDDRNFDEDDYNG